jgi:hypothetical protein
MKGNLVVKKRSFDGRDRGSKMQEVAEKISIENKK